MFEQNAYGEPNKGNVDLKFTSYTKFWKYLKNFQFAKWQYLSMCYQIYVKNFRLWVKLIVCEFAHAFEGVCTYYVTGAQARIPLKYECKSQFVSGFWILFMHKILNKIHDNLQISCKISTFSIVVPFLGEIQT